MQNQIYSYSFPLFEEAYNAFIGSFRSKQLLLAGPQRNGKSVLNLFSYEDENLKKSAGQSRIIDGRFTSLIVGQKQESYVALATAVLEDKHNLISVRTEKIVIEGQECASVLHSQNDPISCVALKPDLSSVFIAGMKEISLFDLEKKEVGATFEHKAENIDHLMLDPNFQMLTYVSGNKQVVICDKKSNSQKHAIRGSGAADIIGIDYNPNKQYCLMTCHQQSIKFWDIRRGAIPFKTYEDHHNLLTQAKYNHSHDQLIACGYDDGSVGLLRLVSASSSIQGDAEDALVRLYDEHEDSVLRLEWACCSPWIFMSVSCNPSLLVLNLVPNAEKYRILL